MIEVKNLVKYYGDQKAVNDISFTVNDNEVLGFAGPNGAGKSTTMNIITGYISMTSGEVKICGEDILGNPIKAKKNIGYLPEQPPVYPEMTVNEYLCFVGELKGIKNIKEEIKNSAEKTGLTNVMKRRIGNLSKGYRQRVGFAAALIGNPNSLILDEPTVGLDPNQIIEIRELIKELGKTHSIILSSHILSEMSAVCDRVLIIKNGEIVAEDTPQNLEEREKANRINRLLLRIDGDDENIVKVLENVENITYEKLKNGEYEINSKYNDISKKLFFAFANAGMAILSQQEEKVSLEDVFIELTKEE